MTYQQRASTTIRDWKVVLEPVNDPEWPAGGGILDIIRGDEQDAIERLEFIAELITVNGRVPRMMDWQNESTAGIVSRMGKMRFRVRVDSFERETNYGWTTGAGFLYVKAAANG